MANDLASLQISDKTGNTPLHWTMMDARDGFKKCQYLIKRENRLLSLQNNIRNRPIQSAARQKDKQFLEYILSLKIYVKVNAPGHRERTTLHMTSFKGELNHIDMPLQYFDININYININIKQGKLPHEICDTMKALQKTGSVSGQEAMIK